MVNDLIDILKNFVSFADDFKEFFSGCLKTFGEFLHLILELNSLFMSMIMMLPGELAPILIMFVCVIFAVLFFNLFNLINIFSKK